MTGPPASMSRPWMRRSTPASTSITTPAAGGPAATQSTRTGAARRSSSSPITPCSRACRASSRRTRPARADDPHAALVGDYYTSCLAGEDDSSSRAVLLAHLAKIDGVATLDDLARQVAAQRDVGSASFFRFYVTVDPGDATRYTTTLYQG